MSFTLTLEFIPLGFELKTLIFTIIVKDIFSLSLYLSGSVPSSFIPLSGFKQRTFLTLGNKSCAFWQLSEDDDGGEKVGRPSFELSWRERGGGREGEHSLRGAFKKE